MAKKLMCKILGILFLFLSCNIPLARDHYKTDIVPDFNQDSAFKVIERLVSFGPRVPNTSAHYKAKQYIVKKLRQYGFEVKFFYDTVQRYDGEKMFITNIFAQYKPKAKKRILLYTHWDTRFIAEKDQDSVKRTTPIPGANDSGSGVAVLLEIARQLYSNPLDKNIGIDIMFFDAEDQGPPVYDKIEYFQYWALGSKSWAKKIAGRYKPMYAIGVDMVAGKQAKFAIEDFSLLHYGYLIKRIWILAKQLGYDTLFVDKRTRGLYNDHVPLFQIAKIRAVLIVENIPGKTYGDYWHTHRDTLDIIDKRILKAVGQTVLTVIYNE